MKCSKVHKNLSAFLDNELNSEMRDHIELHISECAGCRREIVKLKEMISIISKTERPEVPPYLWESIKHRLEVAQAYPSSKKVSLKIPKWSFIPAGAVVFTVLMYVLISQFSFKNDNSQIPVAVYLQEHKRVYSEQSMLIDTWSELVSMKTNGSNETQSNAPVSELDIFMEAHYGGIQTSGS